MRFALVAAWLVVVAGAAWASPLDDGKASFGRQDWRSAASSFAQFLAENPDSTEAPTAAFLRGVALYQQGDFRGSLDAFQKLERSWPHSSYAPRLPFWKGSSALAAGQAALAERELLNQSRYPDQEPFTTRALLNLALARIALGKSEAAVEALTAFTRVSQEPALLAQAWSAWADLDKKAGRNDEALGHYRASSAANPGDRWDLWSLTQELDLLILLGRFSEAQAALDQATSRFPGELERWDVRRISVTRGLKDHPGLLRVLESLWGRETDPKKKQELASNRARTAEEAGTAEVLWWLRASIGPETSVGIPAILRGAFLWETEGRLPEAAEALESWANAHPGASPAGLEEIRSRAAQDRWASGDSVRAAKLWDRLVADYPTSSRMPSWLLARGRVRLDSGDTTRALIDFSRVLKEYPKSAEAGESRYQTGLVYLKRQEPARAEAWFYPLVEELGSGELYERALLARGVCFVNAGKTDLARGSLQRLIREVPSGPWVGDAWAALGRNALQASLFDEAAEAFGRAETTLTDPEAKARSLWSQAEALSAQSKTVEAASAAYARYAVDYPKPPRAIEARYRQGAVFLPGKEWAKALEVWNQVVGWVSGETLAQTREGIATVLLRLGRAQDGWAQLETLEAMAPSPEAWYRWGLTASSMGESDWAVKAFQYLLQHHPASSVAEAALPRAAGALLNGGKADQALGRYADYFQKFGHQPSAAPVARAAATGALPFPATLEALVTASRTWDLAPEVAAEFSLAWAQSRLDSDTEVAQSELKSLGQSAPWASQRSEALLILGRWHRDRGRLSEARTLLESAAGMGDDLSLFKARWALAQVSEGEGDLVASARQRESAEKAAGPGVPLEFRLQVLKEAVETWTKAGRSDDAKRVARRISALAP